MGKSIQVRAKSPILRPSEKLNGTATAFEFTVRRPYNPAQIQTRHQGERSK